MHLEHGFICKGQEALIHLVSLGLKLNIEASPLLFNLKLLGLNVVKDDALHKRSLLS